ncbi:LysR family transcriptional regulator [Novosphingobium sp. PP1Y]|uniref:LysR family transcriptional regulator n=1 Tax=Novosphingobium sp. PP1Y TaxID=702113 RepID=UPI00020EF8DD|nr:LysR family transcriptional regulator [Novosphingobium sp. PP1Y]CCA90749.1 transcription regulator protein [Novosphingobium sp. PP1Y]
MDVFASLKAFLSVADEGGFAPAARKAGVATSSLTRQVDALEEHLTAVLFNRSTRSVTLTPAGEDYYVQAARIVADLEEANRSVSEREGTPRGLLRVSLPVAFARLHVAPVVPAFLRACPEVELEMIMTDEVVNLVEDRIDVAIRLGSLESSSLIARRLAPHRRILCASPAYLEERGEPLCPSDLAAHECLTFSYASGDRTWRFSCDGKEELVRVRGKLRANHSETLREVALAGLGLLLMPSWLVGPDIAAGTLRPLLTGWEANIGKTAASPDAGIYAVYQSDRRTSAKLRAFVDFLEASFGTPPYWDRCEPSEAIV